MAKIQEFFADSLSSRIDADAFCRNVKLIAEAARLPVIQRDETIVSGFVRLVERALEDHVLSESEENRVAELREAFGYSSEDFQTLGLQERLVKAAILRDAMEGSPKSRLSVSGALPFALQKSEELVWLFQDVDYHMMKDRVQYVGGSRGISVRVARGVYLRAGGYRGERITTQSLEFQDRGSVGITTKNVYFKGPLKGFRIALTKLIAVERFSDGIGIMKDGANPRLQILAVDDPWFASNLIAQL